MLGSPDLSHCSFASARFLTEAGVGMNPAIPVTVIREWPIMVNYKFLLVRRSDRVVLNLAPVIEYLKSVKESERGFRFQSARSSTTRIAQTYHSSLSVPAEKKRVNVFYRGKVNILGASDTESPPRNLGLPFDPLPRPLE